MSGSTTKAACACLVLYSAGPRVSEASLPLRTVVYVSQPSWNFSQAPMCVGMVPMPSSGLPLLP